ncbi:crotonase/enoyl-CoA hydratase family protein [Sphingomonas sp. MAH-20]|uniref:Crotonase/enoyl-CoA hydratase family protein n=1 Tax=Sphingomonas horti TaxID=2682842 RepID=A0A6I4IY29_9SPHN|nr:MULTISPECIES: crotonase/enoyl-CoA hydratase family protein [Sphingomonas]MBA2918054.1 crotonase/enoyl-CoA hydratase family protein [Sphingomonas sp. CGMCC 1.13658]MVO77025.1 crotonase/enoyl-CoA hydratase family protein [Sphingomonas horti]
MSKVLLERRGHATVVTINRPERRNAVDAETASLLRTAFDAFDSDPDARVAVLTGAGGSFCAGYDLHSVASAPPPYDPNGPGPMGPTRMLLSKPVIAAVEGHAVAGGLELALWCDLRVASASATFGVFCRRWGVPLIDGGTVRLPRIVGQGRALDMILTGRPVGAEEALAIGLANRVTREGEALDGALELADAIAAVPQMCMRADRLSAYRQWDADLTGALRAEAIGGEAPLRAEGLAGAGRFAGGAGRGGQFQG